MLSVEIRLFHRIFRKAFHRPTHERLWCGKVIPLGGNQPLVSSFLSHPSLPWEKSNCVFNKAKTEASVQSFRFTSKQTMMFPVGLVVVRWSLAPKQVSV